MDGKMEVTQLYSLLLFWLHDNAVNHMYTGVWTVEWNIALILSLLWLHDKWT